MRHIDTVKKAVVFTDIKDFTLKNSLLTQKQIRDFLNTQDTLIFPIIEKYHGTLIKTIGDSYMIVFDELVEALEACVKIQETLTEYNSKINYNLNKLELRISLNYGEMQKEETVFGEDYFGDVVNIASRMQVFVGENQIFTTREVVSETLDKGGFYYVYLGKTTLRGILHEIDVYEIIYKEREITLLREGKNLVGKPKAGFLMTPELKEKINDVKGTILEYSLVTAIFGMINVPYVGGYVMFPMHMYILHKIARKYSVRYWSKKEFSIIILTIIASLGGIFLIREFYDYLSISILAPYASYYELTLNFALSFVLGKCLNDYLWKKSRNIENTNEDLKKMLNTKEKNVKGNFRYSKLY